MENTTPQQPYSDSPPSTPPPHHTSSPLTSSTDSTSTIKTLPALPIPQAPAYEPYRDEPQTPTPTDPSQPHHAQQRQPYTDTTPPFIPNLDDENIPLAHLLLNPYPHEAPPSYSVAVRQTHSHRDTLIQYIPSNSVRPVLIEIDEESGEVLSRTDDIRHSVEKVVAMFVVAGLLLILSGVLAWLAMGTGVLGW